MFSTLFVTLLVIQGYMMYKTYQVKEREINRSVVDKLMDYTDQLEDKSGIKKVQKDSIQNILILKKEGDLNEEQFLKFFEKIKRETQPDLSHFIDREFKNEGYKIALKIQYLSIISLPEKVNLNKKPITLYETEKKISDPGTVSTGKWQTSSTSTEEGKKNFFKINSFEIKSRTEFQILNIKQIVFKELILLIFLCVFILCSVLFLFILTVKNLIQQQKQVEILHNVVDNISHEFKTPIATLKIAAKALNKNWNRDNLPLVERQIARLENVMLQINPNEDYENLKQNISHDEWNYFITDLKFLHPNTDFIIINNSPPIFPVSSTDMETIVKNLAENSVKYGASKITTVINCVEKVLRITVTDNGQGIEKKEQKNVFEKFYRIQFNNVHNSKGLGLGLYLVNQLVKKHNGRVNLISAPNEGSTFEIILPYGN